MGWLASAVVCALRGYEGRGRCSMVRRRVVLAGGGCEWWVARGRWGCLAAGGLWRLEDGGGVWR